jgi:hypothetical protein
MFDAYNRIQKLFSSPYLEFYLAHVAVHQCLKEALNLVRKGKMREIMQASQKKRYNRVGQSLASFRGGDTSPVVGCGS